MTPDPVPLLAAIGLAELRRLACGRALFAFDFDGTLAPIRTRPEDVEIEPALSRALSELAKMAPVAVITGRRVEDVRSRLHFIPTAIVGNHGAEDPDEPELALAWTHRLTPLRKQLLASVPSLAGTGIVVEDKGPSIALHYRAAPDPQVALAAIARLLPELPVGIQRFEGLKVVNLVAEGAPDKAAAVLRLLSRFGCDRLFFVGDDVNDEPVFAVAQQRWVTVKVGWTGPTSARFFLDDRGLVGTAVCRILDAVKTRNAGGGQSSASSV